MPIKKIIKQMAFFSCFISILSCENNRLVDLESNVNELIIKNKLCKQVNIKMDTINSFEWDSLLVVGPYSLLENISEKESVKLNKIPNTIQHHDSFILIIFLNNNEGIKWIEIDRANNLETLFRDGNGYSFYPKAESNFILKN